MAHVLFHGSFRLPATATLLLLVYKFTRSGCCLSKTFLSFMGLLSFILGYRLILQTCPFLITALQGSLVVWFGFITSVSSASCAWYYLPDLVAAHGTPDYSDLLFSFVLNVCRALTCFSQHRCSYFLLNKMPAAPNASIIPLFRPVLCSVRGFSCCWHNSPGFFPLFFLFIAPPLCVPCRYEHVLIQ